MTLDKLMNLNLNHMEGGGGLGVLPGEILVEYVQNCDILDYLGRKPLPTEQFLFLILGYWNVLNGIKIISNDFENSSRGLGVE